MKLSTSSHISLAALSWQYQKYSFSFESIEKEIVNHIKRKNRTATHNAKENFTQVFIVFFKFK